MIKILTLALGLSITTTNATDLADRGIQPTEQKQSQTARDLSALISTSLNERINYNRTLDESLAIIQESDSPLLRALKSGESLFRIACQIESVAAQQSAQVWWRYQSLPKKKNGHIASYIEDEDNLTSFGLSLLAGYKEDGCRQYGSMQFYNSNATACAYIYYANSLLARDLIANKLSFAKDLMNGCIERNIINDDLKEKLSKLINDLEERLLVLETARAEGTLINYIQQHGITATNYNIEDRETALTHDIITWAQFHSNFKKEHQGWIDIMHDTRRAAVYHLNTDTDDLTNYALGTLTAFIFPQPGENILLNRKNNREVMSRDRATLEGRGETFHPKLGSNDVQALLSYGIDIYRDLILIAPDDLDKRMREILRITN